MDPTKMPGRATTRLAAVTPPVDKRREGEEDQEVFAEPVTASVTEMFEYLSRQMSEIARGVRAGRDETHELRAEVVPQIAALNKRVFGTSLPPLDVPKIPVVDEHGVVIASLPPLTKRMATNEGEIGALQQEVTNLRGDVEVVKRMNGQQSKAMGLAPPEKAPDGDHVIEPSRATKARAYLFSRAGLKDAIALATIIAVILGLIRGVPPSTVAAQAAGQPPLPPVAVPR